MSFLNGKDSLYGLYKLFLPEKKILSKFMVSLVVSSGAALCFPLAMVIDIQKDIYNLCKGETETKKTETKEILKSVGKWTVVFTIGAIATYYRRLTIDQLVIYKKANKLAMTLRKSYYEILLQKRINVFAEQNSGNLAHQLSHDIWQISYTLTYEISSAMRGVAFFTGGIGFLLYTSAPLTLVTLAPISSLALVSRYYGNNIKKRREEMAEVARANHTYAQERLSQIKTVKLFTAEGFEIKKYSEMLQKLLDKSMEVAQISAKHHGLIEGLGQNAILWCIGYGAYLISIDSGLSLGKLTAFAMYSMYSGLGFRLLSSGYTELKKVSGIYKQIYNNIMLQDVETVTFDSEKILRNV
jgi:ABC-type multidrug transport system fused ATPase/permease subunit